ncbi:MAG: acyl-CoA/acyl-ACP dehydrogenase [Acidimicrobiia bacterium]|nr:acyl-CoA/acyl-ACP dehydrogenase [Acidimicrobiia bacterium]
MDLDFTGEQELLRETVRGVCAQHAAMDAVRASEDDPNGFPAELWKQLGELDLIGLTLPEEAGGSGQTALEAVILYEEMGRALAPSPHFVSAVMAGGVLTRAGNAAQQERWLPGIASGQQILTTAWLEAEHGFGAEGVALRAEPDGTDVVLSGTKTLVPYANVADRLVVLARTGDAPAAVDLFLVDPAAAGVTMEPCPNIASENSHTVRFEGVRVSGTDRVGEPGTGWATWDETMCDGAILLAAQAIGGAAAVIAITVDYALNREQFDKPLAAFQSLSHYLADRDTEVEGARTLVYEAAWARATGRPVTRLAPMAKYMACRTFVESTKTAQQIWGGMGFTLEADVQLFFRRAKALQLTWWDDRHCEERIAADVLD